MTPRDFARARALLSLTQAEMAKALGYSDPRVISAKERDRRKVSNQDEIIVTAMLKQAGKLAEWKRG